MILYLYKSLVSGSRNKQYIQPLKRYLLVCINCASKCVKVYLLLESWSVLVYIGHFFSTPPSPDSFWRLFLRVSSSLGTLRSHQCLPHRTLETHYITPTPCKWLEYVSQRSELTLLSNGAGNYKL